jgi:malonate transporter
LIETGQNRGAHPLAMARNIGASLVRSPLMIAIVLGGGFAALGLHLPEPVAKAVGMVGAASGALALVTIGASLAGVSLAGQRGVLGVIAAGKLLVHPACVGLALWLVPVADPLFRSGVLLSASLPMVTIFPVMAQRTDDTGTCSAALLVTTFVAFGTLLPVLAWLGA